MLNGYRGIATLTHSTVSGNSARGNGGGVGNLFRGRNTTNSTATLSRTVVSGNTASATPPPAHLERFGDFQQRI